MLNSLCSSQKSSKSEPCAAPLTVFKERPTAFQQSLKRPQDLHPALGGWRCEAKWFHKNSGDMGLSENVGYIPNEIAIFHRDNDQQNHWVHRGTQHFQTHPYHDVFPVQGGFTFHRNKRKDIMTYILGNLPSLATQPKKTTKGS